jgi:protein gp37
MSTKIQWTEETWNPIAGCSVVSPGCTNCYAMRRQAPRLAANPQTPQYHGTIQKTKGGAVWTGKIGIAGDGTFLKPLRTRKPTMFFVNSMSDLFHENVPDEVIDRIFAIMALCPQHTFQALTKRSTRMRKYLDGAAGRIADAVQPLRADKSPIGPLPHVEPGAYWWPLPNVWLGVSVEDQARADERIPDLLATPAARRFISAEPLLGPVGLDRTLGGTLWIGGQRGCGNMHRHSGRPGDVIHGVLHDKDPNRAHHHHDERCRKGLDWVIVGGESGAGARPMHPDWARSIRDQCAAADVPFFFKQWGEWEVALDRDHDDPDWRLDYSNDYVDHGKSKWLNLEGGCGVHGERFHVMRKVGTKRAGRRLDGIEHNALPERA